MARKKKRDIEDNPLTTNEIKTEIKRTSSRLRAEQKRRKVADNEEYTLTKLAESKTKSVTNEIKSEKKIAKPNGSKSCEGSGPGKLNNSVVVNDKPKPKSEPATKKRPSRKKSTISENEPKIKKAKVILKKLKTELEENPVVNENCSSSSMDSGILSDPFPKAFGKSSLKSKSVPAQKLSSSKDVESSGIVNGDSSSESEWEEVEENDQQSLDNYDPVIPKEGVEITIDCADLKSRRRKKKKFDEMEYVRLYINKMRREEQLNIHKVHLLCLLAHGYFINELLNSPILKGIALSLLPSDILTLTSGKKIDKFDCDGIERISKWFRNTFSFETKKDLFVDVSKDMIRYFEERKSLNASEYNLMFIIFARTLGFKARFCVSLYAICHKAQNLIKKPNDKQSQKKTELPCCSKVKQEHEDVNTSLPSIQPSKKKHGKKKPKVKKEEEKITSSNRKEKTSRPKRSTEISYKISDDSADDFKDEDFTFEKEDDGFEETKPLKKRTKRKSNRKILSSGSEPSSPQQIGYAPDEVVCWAEVFSKVDKQWISIDCANNIVNKPYDIEANVPHPVTYILAFDNSSYVKDVTRRYCSNYMISTIKLRADPEWWDDTLSPFLPPNSKLDKEEEKSLETTLINQPLPHTVAGFKNHPLYALKRHLLKFEAIYPPDAPTVGFIRGEPVYARECVVHLHSRETWLKEARVVRIGEEPYKIVKARPKWDRINGVVKTDIPLDIFGFWQTEPYEPPIAVDGKVPRSEYGNVELFKPCMLPRGTVHLQLSGLNRIAKKLGIDCASAVTGFDVSKGSIHPVFDGFIVCEEYKDTIIAAWEEEQENIRKREEEKREKRIYGNWKKLIRGLLIRERIKLKYNV